MQNLYRTATVVTVFAVIEHGLGFLYRIILSRMLGAEGLGVYQVALTVFAVFLTLSSSGLPITLSRVISKHRAKGYKRGEQSATTAAILISLMFSLPLTLLLFLFRGKFSAVFSDSRCADLFYIVLFGLSFTSVYAIIRGCFWGNKRFLAYSLIELIEEIIMIVVGVMFLLFVGGISDVNKAAIAVLISYLSSFAIAVFYFIIKGGRLRSPKGEFLPLLKSSLPVTAMRTSSSLMGSLISVLFPMRLMAAGFSSSLALSEYGVFYGMVMPVLMIPSSLIGSIALVLVPELSECFYKNQSQKLSELVQKALATTLLIVALLMPFFIVCGQDVGVFLYSNAESGKMIARCALILIPMSLTMISTSILNSLGQEKQTLLFFLFGSAAMLLCVWFLPKYLAGGALAVGMAGDFLITGIFSLILLRKKTGKLCKISFLLRAGAATAIVTVLGILIRAFFAIWFSYMISFALSFICVAVLETLFFSLFRLVNVKALFKKYVCFRGLRQKFKHRFKRKKAAKTP